MSGQQSIGLTLVSPDSVTADSGDWLKLVQPPWPEPPDGGFAEWLAINGYGYSLQTLALYWSKYKSHCYNDGSCTVELEIHKSRPDLDYTLTASYGELSELRLDPVERKKSITVAGQADLDLEQMVVGDFSAVWEGPVYNMRGSVISPPPRIYRSGSVLSFGGEEVVGVVRVSYTEEHDACTLTIVPRLAGEYQADELESAYQSTAIAIWGSGNIETLEIELPNMSGNCRGGSNVSINPDDPDDPDGDEPGEGDCYDLYLKKHKCTGEILSERKVAVPCPGDD